MLGLFFITVGMAIDLQTAADHTAAVLGTIRDEENPALLFGMTSSAMLERIASGEVDCVALANIILKGRK